MKTFKLTALAAGTLLSLSAVTASAVPLNLVANGGFESTWGITQSSNLRTTVAAGSTFVDNWSVTPTPSNLASNAGLGQNYSFVYMPGQATTTGALTYHPTTGVFTHMSKLWAATDSPTGGNFIAIDGDPAANGYIHQQLSGLTIGQTYHLAFDYAGGQFQPFEGTTTEAWQVQFGDQIVTTPALANANHGFTGWLTQTYDFIATSTSQQLSFLAIGGPAGLPPVSLLDNVRLFAPEEPPIGVPEPASLALLLTGLLSLGATRRRNAKAAPTLAA